MSEFITVSVKTKNNRLKTLMREAPQKADQAIGAAAFEGLRYLIEGFTTSPSAPGEFPGVDIGAYKNSAHVEPRGRFRRAIVTGTEYGPPLEFGTSKMASRPHMAPTAHWLGSRLPNFFDEFLK